MAIKTTKREYFAMLKDIVADNENLVAFIDHEIELLDKKNASRSTKPSKEKQANAKLREKILGYLADRNELVSVKEVANAIPELDGSTARVGGLMRALVNDDKVKKSEIKGKVYYELA